MILRKGLRRFCKISGNELQLNKVLRPDIIAQTVTGNTVVIAFKR